MQPRRLLCPLREVVFHVTNSGYSSLPLPCPTDACEDRELAGVSAPEPSFRLLGVEEAADRVDRGRLLFELPALAASSLVNRRDTAAGRSATGSSISAPSSASDSSSSCSAPSPSICLSSILLPRYCTHSSSTCARLNGWRCSKLATRHSKAYAQCACVAIRWLHRLWPKDNVLYSAWVHVLTLAARHQKQGAELARTHILARDQIRSQYTFIMWATFSSNVWPSACRQMQYR